ncbi:MAG: hypothetical protein BRD50_09330, partial [Bacteroidetes bacterium SW_11_45_7]
MNVDGYQRLVFRDVYPAIDWHLYSNNRGLKYYFVVNPGGNPQDIRMNYTGAADVFIEDRQLHMESAAGTLVQDTLLARQRVPGGYDTVNISYVHAGNEQYKFQVGAWDQNRALVIEVDLGEARQNGGGNNGNLNWSTYQGGASPDKITDISVDQDDNLFTTGEAQSKDFPVSPGLDTSVLAFDGFVSKFDSLHQLKWSTYYGASDIQTPKSIETDGYSGSIYMGGNTGKYQSDFIIKAPDTIAYTNSDTTQNNFITRFKKGNGQLEWSTYLGTGLADTELSNIGISSNGRMSITGYGNHVNSNFPTLQPNGNAFIDSSGDGYLISFTNNLEREWATRFGDDHSYPHPSDIYTDVSDIRFDSDGELFITGWTNNEGNFPTAQTSTSDNWSFSGSASYVTDAFIAKFDTNYSLEWSTFFGGSSNDFGRSLGISNNGHVYLIGTTVSG